MSTFEGEWRARFERFAQSYAADHLISGWSANGLRQRFVLFDEMMGGRHFSASAQVLDLGCGAGTYVRFLAGLGYHVVGLDYSLPSLHRALAGDPQRVGHYIGGTAYHLPFRNECFDVVVSIGVLQTLAHPDRAFDEMVRVLRPKGLLVVEFLNTFELLSWLKRVGERLHGRLPRVLTYSPLLVHRHLARRGLRLVQRVGIYLPPRGLPWLGRIFDRKGIGRLIDAIPGLSLASAHAFLLAAEKGSVSHISHLTFAQNSGGPKLIK